MEEILEALINRIGQNLPYLRTVDEDYGQLEGIDQDDRDEYPVVFPAVFIEIGDTTWQDIAELNQLGTTNIKVRLAIDCYDDTHYGSGTVDKIRDRQNKRKELHCLLHGCSINGQRLLRTTSRSYTAAHGIKVYESNYTIAESEYISNDKRPVKAKISLTTTLEK